MKRTALILALCAMAAPAIAAGGKPGSHFIENWDMDANGSVTLEDIQSRRSDVFASFDADDNGALDAEEYSYFDEARANDMNDNGGHGEGSGLQRLNQGMTLAFNDADGNGEVSREEFIAKSADWLAMMDRNGDGGVTSEDFGRQ